MFFWHMLRAHKLLGRSPEEQERAASASAGQLNLKRVSRPVHAPCSSTAKATAYGSALGWRTLGIVVLHGVVTLVQLLIHGHLGQLLVPTSFICTSAWFCSSCAGLRSPPAQRVLLRRDVKCHVREPWLQSNEAKIQVMSNTYTRKPWLQCRGSKTHETGNAYTYM